MEEKRNIHASREHSPPRIGRRPSQSIQGRAFAAPRMQSLDRMRSQVEDIQELGRILDHSPRKHTFQQPNADRDYRTPPSNRKGRIVDGGEAADLQDRLRRVRSNETMGPRCQSLGRGNSSRSKRAESAMGFRDAEVREDIELGGLGLTGEAPLRQRMDRGGYRFVKKRSMERWKDVANVGVGWLKGSGRDEQEGEDWI
jgi:hypothetical protein